MLIYCTLYLYVNSKYILAYINDVHFFPLMYSYLVLNSHHYPTGYLSTERCVEPLDDA